MTQVVPEQLARFRLPLRTSAPSAVSVYETLKVTRCRTTGSEQPSLYSVVSSGVCPDAPHPGGYTLALTFITPNCAMNTLACAVSTQSPDSDAIVNVAVIVALVQVPPLTARK